MCILRVILFVTCDQWNIMNEQYVKNEFYFTDAIWIEMHIHTLQAGKI